MVDIMECTQMHSWEVDIWECVHAYMIGYLWAHVNSLFGVEISLGAHAIMFLWTWHLGVQTNSLLWDVDILKIYFEIRLYRAICSFSSLNVFINISWGFHIGNCAHVSCNYLSYSKVKKYLSEKWQQGRRRTTREQFPVQLRFWKILIVVWLSGRNTILQSKHCYRQAILDMLWWWYIIIQNQLCVMTVTVDNGSAWWQNFCWRQCS